MSTAQSLLAELGKSLNCDIELNDFGLAEITLDNKIPLLIEYNDEINAIILNAIIAKVTCLDATILADMYHELLCGNYMWACGGGNIAIDSDTDIICLHRMVELPVAEYAHFEDIVFAIASAAEYWIDYVAKMQNDPHESLDSMSNNALRV